MEESFFNFGVRFGEASADAHTSNYKSNTTSSSIDETLMGDLYFHLRSLANAKLQDLYEMEGAKDLVKLKRHSEENEVFSLRERLFGVLGATEPNAA